ncbi:MAG: TRAP transporter large permease subunit [Pseudomonadota bacterium]
MGIDLILVALVFTLLMAGYPAGITLGGVSVLVAVLASMGGAFDPALFQAIPSRVYGIMSNGILLAIPLFVFMGLVLDRSQLAADMLRATAVLGRNSPRGLAISVTIVGAVLAASTGIVGASIVTLGLIALPSLLRSGITPAQAGGTVAAVGTLGQIIPPSIVLIVLGDQMSAAWQQAQLSAGNFAPDPVTVSDLFVGAIAPGLLIAGLYVAYQWLRFPSVVESGSSIEEPARAPLSVSIIGLLSPMFLIVAVLGSVVSGLATPTEAASLGAAAALLLALLLRRLTLPLFREIVEEAAHLTSIIFLIVIGASMFSLVFRGLGGEARVEALLGGLPGGAMGAVFVVMVVIFVLGFFLEFLEITYLVVPLVAPVLLALPMADGQMMSPVWLGVLIAVNLQTSFLTPPFGVSLFYLRSVAARTITTTALYRGVAPYVLLQLIVLGLLFAFPGLATSLPKLLSAG